MQRSVGLIALALEACAIDSLSSTEQALGGNEQVFRVVDLAGDRIEVRLGRDVATARRVDRELSLVLPVREKGTAELTVFDGDQVVARGSLPVGPREGLALDRFAVGPLSVTTSTFSVRLTRTDDLGPASLLHADFLSPRGDRLDVSDIAWRVDPEVGRIQPLGLDALFTQRIDGPHPVVAICTESGTICWDGRPLPRNQAGVVRRSGAIQSNIYLTPAMTSNDHTISMWFMAQYPRYVDGALFSNSPFESHEYGVSIGGGPNNEVWLDLRMGGVVARYLVPGFERSSRAYPWPAHRPPPPTPAKWHHLAVVRIDTTLRIYVDGTELLQSRKFPPPADGFAIPTTNTWGDMFYTGPVSLGSRPTQGRPAQFYGLVDDFAVFSKAKTATEIAALANTYRLTGDEPDLLAAVLFDGLDPRSKIKQPTFERESWAAPVSAYRDVGIDQAVLPLPYQRTALQLPFAAPEVWQVVQEFDSDYSHWGYASFCSDFSRVPDNVVAQAAQTGVGDFHYSMQESANQRVLSTMTGYTTYVTTGVLGEVMIERDTLWPREMSYIAHLEASTPRPTVNQSVGVNSAVGQVDSTAQHLHVGAHDGMAGDMVTYPFAFSDYEVSRDFGVTWQYVARGIPRYGEWVRRATVTPHIADRFCEDAIGDERVVYDCD